jgi:ribosomal protein S18 acetylase RimI-like enzyme
VKIMTQQTLLPVHESDQGRVWATLVAAFAADPVERWLYPNADQYLACFPAFLAAFGGRAFDTQTVYRLGEYSAVAIWLPPGAEADGDAIASVLADTVAPSQHHDMFSVLSQMETAHPAYPHWYLPWFGVDCALQGRGLGSELIRPCLVEVDRSQLPAYLETPNPRTVPFYERAGFEVTGQAMAGDCPPVTFMLRTPR